MNKRHIVEYSVIIILFLSFGLRAQAKTKVINTEEIKTLVKKNLQAMQQGKHAEIVALRDFRDDKDRDAFQEACKKRGAVTKWNLTNKIHVVRVKQKKDHTQALLLLPTKQGFILERFSVREIKGHLKIVHDSAVKTKEQGVNVVSDKIAELQASLKSWKSVNGLALSQKILVLQERILEEIDALEYAKTNNLKFVSGYGDLTMRYKISNDINNLSEDDLRSKVVGEIQSVLKALSP